MERTGKDWFALHPFLFSKAHNWSPGLSKNIGEMYVCSHIAYISSNIKGLHFRAAISELFTEIKKIKIGAWPVSQICWSKSVWRENQKYSFLTGSFVEKVKKSTTTGTHFGNFTERVQNSDRLMVFPVFPRALLWMNWGRFISAWSLLTIGS